MGGTRTLSSWLTLLIIGTVAPLLLFAGVILGEILWTSRALRDQGHAQTVRALALAVDGEVRSWKAAVTALAESQSLRRGRLAEFHEEAHRVADSQGGWILLTDASGQQVINTLRPYGTPLPKTGAPEAIGRGLAKGKAVVSDLIFGRVAQRFLVAVSAPVSREGQVRYRLDLAFEPAVLGHLFAHQEVPATWVAGIIDREFRVVFRSRDAEQRVGKPVSEWFRAAFEAKHSGIVDGALVDGREARLAFHRLTEVPWALTLAVPQADLVSMRPLWALVLGGTLVSLAAILGAVSMGRRVSAPVGRMAAAGAAVLRGDPVELGRPSGIREVRELQVSLGEASAAVHAFREERKKAEDALRGAAAYNRSLIEASLDPLVTIGTDGKITDVNKATEAMTGIARRELIGTDFSDYFTEPEKARAGYQQAFRDGAVRDYPLEVRQPDGRNMSILYNASVYLDERGGVSGVFAAARDVTDRERAEAEILRLNAELEQRVAERTAQLQAANRELEAFSYSVSHDLRAPLRAVDGFSRILLDDYLQQLPPEAQRYLAMVRTNSQQMGRLIDDLLAFSRLNRQELRKSPTDQAALVADVLTTLGSEREGRQVDIVLGDLPPCEGDPYLLKQVWMNLLSNALKYTRRRAIARIEIGHRREGATGIYYVRDNGVGFDMQYAHKLFCVFQRLHCAEEYEGTGVGLAIVQRIIQRHGGRVWAEGMVDQGATFSFLLDGR